MTSFLEHHLADSGFHYWTLPLLDYKPSTTHPNSSLQVLQLWLPSLKLDMREHFPKRRRLHALSPGQNHPLPSISKSPYMSNEP